ncbi:MAG: class I SAM-dependent methyltransferase [Chloroflexota bacterium]|nr:class I SAM-dependent methyltransferase [Chloroflexota bacterium]
MTGSFLPIKKTVALQWQGRELWFDVAQDLFSSHQIDKGSRLLLDSLDPTLFPESGAAADFGCGYGVLGIAWQSRKPGWSMRYVDRDALAVAFSAHNAEQLGDVVTSFDIDVSLPVTSGGYDLVLWNVPGKAGRQVIAGLLEVMLDTLAPGGLLAVVVVHPIADLFEGFTREDTTIELIEPGAEHTVVHLRRASGEVTERDPFDEGLFDRSGTSFAAAGLEWRLIPVVGLPEYDELGHATQLAVKLMRDLQTDVPPARWLVVDPGVGHLAIAATKLWPGAHGVIAGRDALALRSTTRALAGTPVEVSAVWGIEALDLGEPLDVVILALPAQASTDEIERGIDAVERCGAAYVHIILHGRSTEVARAERVLRRRPRWRTGKPSKQRGFAALTARTVVP